MREIVDGKALEEATQKVADLLEEITSFLPSRILILDTVRISICGAFYKGQFGKK